MNLEIKESKDWTTDELEEILSFISVPEFNGGTRLPGGADLNSVFSCLPSESLAVWADASPSLCLSIIPIDHVLRTGLFHISGDRRLPYGVTEKLVKGWLTRYAREGYSIRAFTSSEAVGRAARRIGFEDWGHDPQTGAWVGGFELHN